MPKVPKMSKVPKIIVSLPSVFIVKNRVQRARLWSTPEG
jgi:hypothetical protein